MIDEKKLIEEFEKCMNDTAYLKNKYSGAAQLKDCTGKNIMYDYAEIAHDVISEVIEKINEQPKVGEWIPVSKRLPPKPEEYHMIEKSYIVQDKYVLEPYTVYWDGEKWTNILDDVLTDIIAWQPLPKRYKEKTEKNSNYMKKIMDKYSRNT